MSAHTWRSLVLVSGPLILVAAVSVLRASGPDLRVVEAVRQRDHKGLAALLRAKGDINAAAPDGATK